MSRIIEKEWFDFAAKVLPGNASEVQRKETRRAFYAGAITLFAAIQDRLSPEADPTPADIGVMESIHQEFLAWERALREGRA